MSYFDVIDPWVRPVKLLECMAKIIDNRKPLDDCILIYKNGANKAHDRWLSELERKGIEVKENDSFRIPPFPQIEVDK